jgi:hypothetical protein
LGVAPLSKGCGNRETDTQPSGGIQDLAADMTLDNPDLGFWTRVMQRGNVSRDTDIDYFF